MKVRFVLSGALSIGLLVAAVAPVPAAAAERGHPGWHGGWHRGYYWRGGWYPWPAYGYAPYYYPPPVWYGPPAVTFAVPGVSVTIP
jgi:hypothetical protein